MLSLMRARNWVGFAVSSMLQPSNGAGIHTQTEHNSQRKSDHRRVRCEPIGLEMASHPEKLAPPLSLEDIRGK